MNGQDFKNLGTKGRLMQNKTQMWSRCEGFEVQRLNVKEMIIVASDFQPQSDHYINQPVNSYYYLDELGLTIGSLNLYYLPDSSITRILRTLKLGEQCEMVEAFGQDGRTSQLLYQQFVRLVFGQKERHRLLERGVSWWKMLVQSCQCDDGYRETGFDYHMP